MPRSWSQRLDDMLGAITNIESINLSELERFPLMQLALERSFEILSEASRHIPVEIKREFDHVRWQDLADFGNLLRHGYHQVSLQRLIETADGDVPTLKIALLSIKSAE